MASHNYFIYITTNPKKTTLYIGMTNDLVRRLEEHASNAGNPSTFAGLYQCNNLVFYERFKDVDHAIEREKEVKKWSRAKKEKLISSFNSEWRFLNEDVQE
ncbi:GIY-YIG nuclease family protein [Pontibacter pamirensis]|uniref:GIY-YIG nuclease family protein n=1 Tax=Pontibacter pamirensis TaxID=2562824 RepID=UPI00138A6C80|nr:GIY-YIG nuclease family protein [Pontibacter pamirensis]